MSTPDWSPPAKIEDLYSKTAGNMFAAINSPTAGARLEKDLPVGNAPIQLYSLATPNGQKASIILEELGIDYDAHVVHIGKGEQFTSGFVAVNPNSKIPALVDREGPGGESVNLFESGAIVLYFAEKYKRFLPEDPRLKAEVMNWVFWQMGCQGPFTGQFGHFFVYGPGNAHAPRDYGTSRYGMEAQRLCSVLDQHLATRTYMVGEEYTIADIMIFPWVNLLYTGYKHSSGIGANEFLSMDQYKNLKVWADRIGAREAVKRGLQVCHWENGAKPWLNAPATTENK